MMSWRDSEGSLNFVLCDHGGVGYEKERDWANPHEKLGHSEYRVPVNLPYPLWQL
jgi:hypothetical protein